MGWPYFTASITAWVEAAALRTALVAGVDFTTDLPSSPTSGNLYLTGPIATLHAGSRLVIERVTPDEQGWVGIQGERERGLEVQLDRSTMAAQELRASVAGALRVTGLAIPAIVPVEGATVLWQGGKFVAGPTASAIAGAQVNAEQSQAAADIVVASAAIVAAQTVIVEAAASALTAVAQNRILGRKTAGPGPVEQLTASDARTVMGLGTAATTAAADYATAAQGGKADTAVQPAAVPSQADVAWINGASAIKGVVGPDQIKLAIAAQVATLRPDWTVLGPTATTSGTFVDFTIPAGVTEMEIIFKTVSCNGTDDPLVRLGVAGAILATAGDYASTCGTHNGSGGVGVVSNTTGFIIFQNNATSHTSGRMKLSLIGDVWIEEGVYSRGGSTTESMAGSGYSKALAGPIDRVRVTSTISNTFDLGSVIVRYK